MNMAWKYQLPAIVLVDKNLSEGSFSFDPDLIDTAAEEEPLVWDNNREYKRYLDTENGISPLTRWRFRSMRWMN